MEPTTDDTHTSTDKRQALATRIEALLFVSGGMSKKKLAEHLGVPHEELAEALALLRERSGGIVMVDDGVNVELRAAPEAAALIEKVRKEEYARDIGKAGLEVLAAILYRGASSRAQVDFIRGVNSSQTLRTLAMRGLVRKITNPRDERSYLYEPTAELLAHLGIAHLDELPDYDSIRSELAALEAGVQANSVEPISTPSEETP